MIPDKGGIRVLRQWMSLREQIKKETLTMKDQEGDEDVKMIKNVKRNKTEWSKICHNTLK